MKQITKVNDEKYYSEIDLNELRCAFSLNLEPAATTTLTNNETTSLFDYQNGVETLWSATGTTSSTALSSLNLPTGHRKSIFACSSSLLWAAGNEFAGKSAPRTPVIISPRARMLEVLLNPIRSKYNPPERVMTVVNDLDREGELSRELLDNLIKLVPTRDEQEALKAWCGDEEQIGFKLELLSVIDRFLYETMSQSFYLEKLELLKLRLYYQETFSFVDLKLNKIVKCCSLLMHSSSIIRLLEIILCIGNYLNQNSRNGDAVGFMISNLTKLCEVKSHRPNYSLLHFLIITIKKKVAYILEFYLE